MGEKYKELIVELMDQADDNTLRKTYTFLKTLIEIGERKNGAEKTENH